MIILLTGTPGTGKSTISPLLADKLGFQLVDINQLVEKEHLYTGVDPEKNYKIVDMEALEEKLSQITSNQEGDQKGDPSKGYVIEGHLSPYFPRADLVIVFRTEPQVLEERLRERNWRESKIRENLEAEALDICTWEAYQIHGSRVHEVETTKITPEKTTDIILDIIDGKKSFQVGGIDFSDYLGS